MKLVNLRMPDGNQWRFACRACGNVKVADDRTHTDKGTFICGECLGTPLGDSYLGCLARA